MMIRRHRFAQQRLDDWCAQQLGDLEQFDPRLQRAVARQDDDFVALGQGARSSPEESAQLWESAMDASVKHNRLSQSRQRIKILRIMDEAQHYWFRGCGCKGRMEEQAVASGNAAPRRFMTRRAAAHLLHVTS